MTTTTSTTRLIRLGAEEHLRFADPADDIRGRRVLDRSGGEVGRVDDLLLDARTRRVRYLVAGSGGRGIARVGRQRRLVPVEAIAALGADAVRVGQGAGVVDEPGYDPEIRLVPEEDLGRLPVRPGGEPYWRPYYRYPGRLIRRW